MTSRIARGNEMQGAHILPCLLRSGFGVCTASGGSGAEASSLEDGPLALLPPPTPEVLVSLAALRETSLNNCPQPGRQGYLYICTCSLALSLSLSLSIYIHICAYLYMYKLVYKCKYFSVLEVPTCQHPQVWTRTPNSPSCRFTSTQLQLRRGRAMFIPFQQLVEP